ncbi:MAG: S8 family serine peptidase, partial [candidate division WOR-3 bacterium]
VAYKHYPRAGGITRTSHGTHTAGTICGNDSAMGGTDARDGHSKNARLVHLSPIPSSSDNFLVVYGTITDSLRNRNIQPVTCSNSWWTLVMGQYSAKSMEVDQFLWTHRHFVMIKSCGNQGQSSQYRITEPGNSKSIISVGALGNGTSATTLASFSSRGPAPDGRVKPEVCTPGDLIYSAQYNTTNSYTSMSGTSMAAPSCNGSIGLIRSYLRKGFYPTGARRSADSLRYISGALLKAMIVVSADPNVGTYVVPSDYIGWGRFDLDSVLFFSTPTVERRRLLLYDDTIGLATGQYRDYQFTVSDGGLPLRAAVTWYDTAAAAGATRAIINNLDVRMIAPNGDSFKGNVYANGQSVRNPTQRYDSIDVLECLRINAPNTGNWTLRVMARNVVTRPQRYAVVLTGGFPLVGITEELVGGVRPTEMALVYGPNPSRIGGSKVRFYAPDVNKRYTLKLYDASGSLLKTLFDARLKTRGWQNINWNGCDDNNRQIPQGVYFYVLENEDKRLSYKVILVR